jgi:hypothetical protein
VGGTAVAERAPKVLHLVEVLLRERLERTLDVSASGDSVIGMPSVVHKRARLRGPDPLTLHPERMELSMANTTTPEAKEIMTVVEALPADQRQYIRDVVFRVAAVVLALSANRGPARRNGRRSVSR